MKKIKGSMAINNFKKIMKTIVNMKCIVMVIFSYTLWGVYCILGGRVFPFSLSTMSWLPWRMFK